MNKNKLKQNYVGYNVANRASEIAITAFTKILTHLKESGKLAFKADGTRSKVFNDLIKEALIDDEVTAWLSPNPLQDGFTARLHRCMIELSGFSGSININFSIALFDGNGKFIEYFNSNSQYFLGKVIGGKVSEVQEVERSHATPALDDIIKDVEEVEALRGRIEQIEKGLPFYARH